jgi:hypothetical protein
MAVLLTGCSSQSGTSGHPAAASTPAGSTVAPKITPSSPAVGAAGSARALLAHAAAVTAALHSYAFGSTETFVASGQSRSAQVTGRVMLPNALSYVLSSGANHTEVIKLRGTTYQRRAGSPWHKNATTGSNGSPLTSLLAILRTLTPNPSTTGGNQVSGTLTQNQARAAGLLGTDVTAPVTAIQLDLDTAGHITRLQITSHGTRGSRPLSLTQTVTYTSFDHAAPIVAPI